MKKRLSIAASALSALALFAVLALPRAARVRETSANAAPEKPDCLRLHVMANSDSEEDQRIKLMVRDAILDEIKGRFSAGDSREAEEELRELGADIQKRAEEVLKEQGANYGVVLVSGEFDFPDRYYGDEFYPAGRYRALRVILGSGGGHNWWCVMYPPLCIIDDGSGVSRNEDGTLVFKSFFYDIWRGIFG